VYLNTSSLHRAFDDLTQARIRQETETVAMNVSALEAGRVTLISSEYLLFEVAQNPNPEQLGIMLATLALAKERVKVSRQAVRRAEELESHGLRGLDAIHIACAESGGADLLITTDDRMLRSSRRAGVLRVRVVAPFEALAEINVELQ
jgi:predicted nucleic acid-binding protein